MALSADTNGRYVAANDSVGTQVTSIARQQQLLDAGYHFEAVVTQATFVEAVALLFASGLRGVAPSKAMQEFEAKLKQGRATFGTVVKAIASAPSVNNALKDELHAYLIARNQIAHSMIASSTLVDLQATYRIGERLILAMPSGHVGGFSAAVFVPYPKPSKPALKLVK